MGTVHAITSAPSRRAAVPAPAPSPDDVAAAMAAGHDLLTTRELSRRLKRSERSIRRDVAAGLPRHGMSRRGDHRFILPHVLAWYAAREGGGDQHEGDAA